MVPKCFTSGKVSPPGLQMAACLPCSQMAFSPRALGQRDSALVSSLKGHQFYQLKRTPPLLSHWIAFLKALLPNVITLGAGLQHTKLDKFGIVQTYEAFNSLCFGGGVFPSKCPNQHTSESTASQENGIFLIKINNSLILSNIQIVCIFLW